MTNGPEQRLVGLRKGVRFMATPKIFAIRKPAVPGKRGGHTASTASTAS
jgi:hypothetical protein